MQKNNPKNNSNKLLANKYRDTILIIFAVLVVIAVIYFCIIGMKNLNYYCFYEENVKQTVREMVKSGALK